MYVCIYQYTYVAKRTMPSSNGSGRCRYWFPRGLASLLQSTVRMVESSDWPGQRNGCSQTPMSSSTRFSREADACVVLVFSAQTSTCMRQGTLSLDATSQRSKSSVWVSPRSRDIPRCSTRKPTTKKTSYAATPHGRLARHIQVCVD